MTVVNESGTAAVEPVQVPEQAVAAAYKWALSHARSRTRGNHEVEDELHDAATNAVMWSVAHCTDATTFPQQCKAAVRLWVSRQVGRITLKRRNRPERHELPKGLVGRDEKPVRPLLIEDLPEDLAFIVRLHTVDGFTVREIGLLTGMGHNTAHRKLQKAAELLAAGRIVPERAKRFTAG